MKLSALIPLAIGMLITGSINTLAMKYQGMIDIPVKDGDPYGSTFFHPFFQVFMMFAAESTSLLGWYIGKSRTQRQEIKSHRPDGGVPRTGLARAALMLIPAMCDLCGSTLLMIGIYYSSASVFQMLRGFIVVITALLSVTFLKRKLYAYHWTGVLFVLIGVTIVGVASIKGGDSCWWLYLASARDPVIGNSVVLLAQVIQGFQYVIEERFVGGHGIHPLEAVGYEGSWGMIGAAFVLSVSMYVSGGERTDYAIQQIHASQYLLLAVVIGFTSMPVYNYLGMKVTKDLSAGHRSVIDSLRTLVVWVYGLSLGWEKFSFIQLAGFVVLVFGTFTYNKLFTFPFFKYPDEDAERKPLLEDDEKTVDSCCVPAASIQDVPTEP